MKGPLGCGIPNFGESTVLSRPSRSQVVARYMSNIVGANGLTVESSLLLSRHKSTGRVKTKCE